MYVHMYVLCIYMCVFIICLCMFVCMHLFIIYLYIMYVCMYVWMYVCMCVYYVCIYVCMYVCIYVCVCTYVCMYVCVYNTCRINVKWSRYRPGVAQRVGRGIALLFHDRGTRRGWVVSRTPRPHFTPRKDPVPILQEAGWATEPVWTGGKSRPHRNSIPHRPARSSVAIPTELPGPQYMSYSEVSWYDKPHWYTVKFRRSGSL